MADGERAQRVLMVDGDVRVRHALADYLRRCGYAVIEAASTDEAAAVLDDDRLQVAAVLCDAEAPGMRNPFELRAWAKARRPGLDVALAGNVEAAASKAADLCERGPQLARPYDPQGVVAYIQRLFGGGDSTRDAARRD